MKLERWLVGSMGFRHLTDQNILDSEFTEEDRIGEFRIILRSRGEIIFDAFDSFAFTWLAIRSDSRKQQVTAVLGSALSGAGYRGIPLQSYILHQLIMPFHAIYSRLLLKHAVAQMLQDAKSGVRSG
jgi:hypothetical protein